MSTQVSHTKLPYGLLELDASGMIVRYAPAFAPQCGGGATDIIGRNFFTEVVPATEVEACHARFRQFMAQGEATDRFSATFMSEQGPVKVQIVLARILEKSERGTERFALVRIMPD